MARLTSRPWRNRGVRERALARLVLGLGATLRPEGSLIPCIPVPSASTQAQQTFDLAVSSQMPPFTKPRTASIPVGAIRHVTLRVVCESRRIPAASEEASLIRIPPTSSA